MVCVHILQSVSEPKRHYVGVTENLRDRLHRHNAGQVSYTSKYVPWEIATYIASRDKERAFALEHYLKSASGRAFSRKRL